MIQFFFQKILINLIIYINNFFVLSKYLLLLIIVIQIRFKIDTRIFYQSDNKIANLKNPSIINFI